MSKKKVLGISLLVIGVGLGLYLTLHWGRTEADFADFGWEHSAFAAAGGHGDAPSLGCFDCHGSHPPKTAPPASEMSCFDCHNTE